MIILCYYPTSQHIK